MGRRKELELDDVRRLLPVCMFMLPECITEVVEVHGVRAEHFRNKELALIFSALVDLYPRNFSGPNLDPWEVDRKIRSLGWDSSISVHDYITAIARHMPREAAWRKWAKMVVSSA